MESQAAPAAYLSNYLWVRKADVKGPPTRWAPGWTHRIELLKTPAGRIDQQQIAFLREQAEAMGANPDDVIAELTEDDHIIVKNWSELKDWWALCLGDAAKVRALVKKLGLELKDRRVQVPWPDEITQNLKMVMKPKEYQPEPFEQWYAAAHGIFEAAPSFGKTYIMCWSIIRRAQRVLVLAHTDVLVEQFITRFRHGSPKEGKSGFYPITNCVELEEELGIPIVGRFRGPDDLYPVTVATWQAFTSAGGRRSLKTIAKEFGYVLCDEAHVFAAPGPASVVNAMHAKVKAGVTATPERKDKLEVALYDTLGPVTAVGSMPQLPVVGYLIATGEKYRGSRFPSKADWAYLLNWCVKQPDRNDLIVEWLRTDYNLGRNILVLADRRDWCVEMTELLQRDYAIPTRAVLGGLKSKRARQEREEVINAMIEGDVRVIFATQTFKAGVDIPNLDTLYAPLPMNNTPQLEQMLGRIRRPQAGKEDVIFRYFVDGGHGRMIGCAKGTHKSLVSLGANIINVPQGRKPERVMVGGTNFGEAAKGLRGVVNKRSDSMNDLFAESTRLSRVER